MPIGRRLALALVLLTLCLASRQAWAQFASAIASAIEGTVTDPSSAVVPGAAVTITNEATGVAQTGHTTTPATIASRRCRAASTPMQSKNYFQKLVSGFNGGRSSASGASTID
jgi:hypothetical protein